MHELQRTSEDNKATLSYVFERWQKISSYLYTFANSCSSFADDINRFIIHKEKMPWKARFDRQITPLHVAAYYLQPQHFNSDILPTLQDQILDLLKAYIPDFSTAYKQFFDFRLQRNAFQPSSRSWTMVDDPVIFWAYHRAMCLELSAFADHLLTTIANSVPSERSFSTINYIHSKTRNALTLERVDKLEFIYINTRLLKKLQIHEPTDADLLVAEDKFRRQFRQVYRHDWR